MKEIKLKSPAKINLTLEILRKLPGGFHELRSIFLKLENLFDEVKITFHKDRDDIRISCNDKNVPLDKKNIVWKVADGFFKKTGKRVGLAIDIKKGIPVAAGLGGGSSNGATVLLALNSYFKKPLASHDLIQLASKIGKDMLFFLQKEKVALTTRTEEDLRAVKKFVIPTFLIIKLEGEISTPWAFGELDKKRSLLSPAKRKNISQALLKNQKNLQIWSKFLHNDFEMIAKEKFPEIEVLEKMILELGALGVSLSGKGPTIFAIFEKKEQALTAKKVLKKYYPQIFAELG